MRPCQLRSTGLTWTGVSPADGAACRRTPESHIPNTIAAELVSISSTAWKTAGLYFRHFRPYIGPWNAIAKGDRGGEQRPRSYAERHLQQAHNRIGRQHTPARTTSRTRCQRYGAFQALRFDRQDRPENGRTRGHRLCP